MKLFRQENGVKLLIHNWCYISDSRCAACNFVFFKYDFVVRLITSIGFSTQRLPELLMSVMRPM